MVLTAGGSVYFFGQAYNGGWRTEKPTWYLYLKNVSSISTGGIHAMAVRLDGSVNTWGQNNVRSHALIGSMDNLVSVTTLINQIHP
jgi:alpha-tubulin suppressor-like RCC1 family protein